MAALIKPSAQSARMLLDRLLDRPSPASLVQSLPADTVLRLVERVGLEDLGDVIALLSPEQLEHVLDQDLWSSLRPGQDEGFDAARFALWLMVLVEQSPELAAKKLAELDFELVALGISKHLIVIDIEQLARQMSHADDSDDDQQLDKLLEASLHHELEQYRVIARDPRSFEAILAVLVELNTNDYGFLSELLERCCSISCEHIEDNGGLYEVLSAEHMIEIDVAAERDQRREQRGFVPPSSALAFLKLARETPLPTLLAQYGPDPVTRAHFRAAPAVARSHAGKALAARGEHDPSTHARAAFEPVLVTSDPAAARLLATLSELVREHTPLARSLPREGAGRASLSCSRAEPRASTLARALRALCTRDVMSYERCVLEASYLANVVLSGVGTSEQRFAASEAAELALAVCELGAEELARSQVLPRRGAAPVACRTAGARVETLVEELALGGLVKLFQLGFHRLCAAKPPALVKQSAALSRLLQVLRAQGLAVRSAPPGRGRNLGGARAEHDGSRS